MTTVTPEPTPAPRPPGRSAWATYGQWWKRTPGSTVYLLAVFVLAITSLTVLTTLLSTGGGLIILVVGLPLLALALLVARGFGIADRWLLRMTGMPAIPEPTWSRDRPYQNGFWMTLSRPLRNAHYWIYLLHGMIVSPIVSIVTFTLTTVWLSISLGGLTYWFWAAFIPRRDGTGEWGQYVSAAVPWLFGGWSSWAVEVVLYLIAGIVFAITLPWAVGGMARAHYAIARGMLGRWPSDDLAAEVIAEAAARGAAVQAEDAALRRLERDIHDGPQQRLVRLQLDLAALERRAAAGDSDAAAQLAREAQGHAKSALDELRALSAGVAPPLLQDRGLAAALQAVAAATALPVGTDIDPEVDSAVSPEVARSVYFIAAELLTNAVKHSGASAATLKAAVRPAAGGEPVTLDVWVVDNGHGGAEFRPGHGLEGLRDRVAGLRGTLVVDSAPGGPTTVGVHLPLAPAVP